MAMKAHDTGVIGPCHVVESWNESMQAITPESRLRHVIVLGTALFILEVNDDILTMCSELLAWVSALAFKTGHRGYAPYGLIAYFYEYFGIEWQIYVNP